MSQTFSNSDGKAVVNQLQRASQRLNADCEFCKLNGLLEKSSCAQPDIFTLERGETLFRAGDPANYLYSLRRGSVKLCRLLPGGEQQIISFHLAGELLGFDSLEGLRYRGDAVTLEPTTVCRLTIEQFRRGSESTEQFKRLIRLIGSNVLALQEHALANRRPAIARLATFLLDIAGRSRNREEGELRFQLPMTRADIACYLAVSPETVSRRLTELQRKRLLTMGNSTKIVQITDLSGLQTIALS